VTLAPVPICLCCKHHVRVAEPPPATPSVHRCDAIYDVVTGEGLQMDCRSARSSPVLCGREGKLFEAAVLEKERR